jgi:glycosyltransferase involved in cell wall biosynthesis
MKRVTFYLADQHPGRDRSLGITGYSLQLLEELQKSNRVRCDVVSSRSSVLVQGAKYELPFRTDSPIKRLIGDHLHGAIFSKHEILHYPKGYLPAFLPKGPLVATIHDTIIQHYVDYYPKERSLLAYAYWLAVTKHSLRKASLILTVSKSAEDAIKRFCSRYAITTPKIHVTYEGASGEEFAGTLGEKQDYCLGFASTQPHKRTERLLEYWRHFESKEGNHPKLLLIGTPNDRLMELALLCKSVEWVQAPSFNDLAKLLRAARGLIFPSEIEGFGLPGVEAYYQGTPVAYVRNTAVEEVLCHPDVGGFDLDDFDSFHAAVNGVLNMPSQSVANHALLLRDKYLWSKVAERTVQAYESL